MSLGPLAMLLPERRRGPFLGGFGRPFRNRDDGPPVRGDAYRDLVPRYAAEELASLRDPVLFANGDVGLVEPDVAGEDDGILASLEDGEHLPEPVNAGGMGVSVVPRGCDDRVELE